MPTDRRRSHADVKVVGGVFSLEGEMGRRKIDPETVDLVPFLAPVLILHCLNRAVVVPVFGLPKAKQMTAQSPRGLASLLSIMHIVYI